MKAPAAIETERLILRRPAMADAALIFERYARDPEVTRFLAWPRHRSRQDTEGFLQFSALEWERWPAGPYLIFARHDGQLLGSTGLAFQEPHDAVTGYVLAKDAWGKGYATDALRAMIDVAAQTGVARLSALCHPDHRRSQRVLEKCGFLRDDALTCRVEFPNLDAGAQQKTFCYTRGVSRGLSESR